MFITICLNRENELRAAEASRKEKEKKEAEQRQKEQKEQLEEEAEITQENNEITATTKLPNNNINGIHHIQRNGSGEDDVLIISGKEDINDNKTLATLDSIEFNHDNNKGVKNHNPDIRLNINGPEETDQLLNNNDDGNEDEIDNLKKGSLSQENVNFETGL